MDKLQAVDYANSKFVFYPADEVRLLKSKKSYARRYRELQLEVCGFNLEFYLVQNYGGGYGAANLMN